MSFYGEALEERLVAGELLAEALMAFDGADDINVDAAYTSPQKF